MIVIVLGDLNAAELYYTHYPELYPNRKGSMVPFGMRVLAGGMHMGEAYATSVRDSITLIPHARQSSLYLQAKVNLRWIACTLC